MTDRSYEEFSRADNAPGFHTAWPDMYFPAIAYDLNPPMPDNELLERVNRWFRNRLPCIAGRREFNKNRYMVSVGKPGRIAEFVADFEARLMGGEATACFVVFDLSGGDDHWTASKTFRWLAGVMSEVTSVDADSLSSGSSLSLEFTLACPVTAKVTTFDDFECIAFCPQSADISDALYDPLMYAPYPAVNISSDVYAFSLFVRDACVRKFGVEPSEVADLRSLFALFYECAERWHVVAAQTIDNFSKTVEDKKRCPVHVTADRTHWIACHKDPAFAESRKTPHIHELPVLYATRICDAWVEHFTHRTTYNAAGILRAGLTSGEIQ